MSHSNVVLAEGIYWVGAVDYNMRDFHGFTTPDGTSYNAYLVADGKVALVDTVKKDFAGELLRHIRAITEPANIDYLVLNHLEMDHAGSFAEVLEAAPRAQIFCSQKCREGLARYYGSISRDFRVVKTGDTLSLGRKTLKFISAPMLHWPDSMVTYCVEDKVLLSNDVFGQHLASPFRFADEVGEARCLDEAAKYYANIFMPYGPLVAKKLDELPALGIAPLTIGPSHGAIWRRDIPRIVGVYRGWAACKAQVKAVIVYDTMWEATEMLARRLAELISAAGVDVKIYRITKSSATQILRDILDAAVVVIGSPTLNAGIYWSVAGFLAYLKGLRPAGKKAAVFGSYGWSEAASSAVESELRAGGFEIIAPAFEVQFVPAGEELSKLQDYAKVIIQAARASG